MSESQPPETIRSDPSGHAILLTIRVQPNAKRAGIEFEESERVRIRVTEPPVDSKANRAVTKALAKALSIPKSSVQLVRGAKSREKVVSISGLRESELRERLMAHRIR